MRKQILHSKAFMLWISLCLHSLLLVFLLQSKPLRTPIYLGDTKTESINAFLVSGSLVSQFVPKTQEKITTEVKNKSKSSNNPLQLVKAKKIARPIKNHKTQSLSLPKRMEAEGAHSNGQRVNALLSLLHARIQAKQKYPSNAQEMGREGRVTVQFILHPNGQTEGIRLIKSSGTTSLDQAALAAVNDAAPFSEAKDYLPVTKVFSVDVIFELA